MKLTSKGRYGLRAIVDLTIHGEKEPVSIKSISIRQGISERYLEQIIGKMKKSWNSRKRPRSRWRISFSERSFKNFRWGCSALSGR